MPFAEQIFDRLAGAIGRWAYSQCIASRGLPAPFGPAWWSVCNKIRQRTIRWWDPVISMDVAGVSLRMPLSHQLPAFWWRHPHYDRALPRIASGITDACGLVRMIDVGANIGDSAAAVLLNPAASCLCVEGDAKNIPILQFNLSRFGERSRGVNVCCDEHRGRTCLAPVREGGTTRFADTAGERFGPASLPLDDIAREYAYLNCNLLKVDTDGFDFKVLRGADELIRTAKPVIYFEWQPEFLAIQNEDPLSIFPWLADRGYESLLLYDNLGQSIAINKTSDDAALRTALSRINGRQIHYYDVLTVHRDAPAVIRDILRSELAAAGSTPLAASKAV